MQYFDEFDERMEREEVTRIENVVNTQLFSSGVRRRVAWQWCVSQMCFPTSAVIFFMRDM